jgi:hypothetical protein
MADLMGDRCRSKAYDYQSALSNLESELSTVDSRVRSAYSSCGIDISSSGKPASKPKASSSGNQMCDLYRSYKNKMPLEMLLKTCGQSMPEVECRKCLTQ